MPLGAIISGIGAGLGFLSDERSRDDTERWNERAYGLSREQWREAQDKTIQNRVRDAKAAGVHPLYALGMPGASASAFIPGQAPSGSHLAEGVQRVGEHISAARENRRARRSSSRIASRSARVQEKVADAQIIAERARARRDLAEAQLLDSQRSRIVQEANHRQDVVVTPLENPRRIPRKELAAPKALVPEPGTHFAPSRSTQAEKMEEEYGDVGGSIYGLYRGFMDWRDLLQEDVRRGPGKRRPVPGWKYRKPRTGAARRYRE